MRNFFLGIAAVERLHPEHRRGLIGHPADGARPGLHAAQRNARRQRNARHFVSHRAGRSPHFHFLGKFDPDEDPLLTDAIRLVAEMQTASTSMLQRRLRLGYTRAGRMIDSSSAVA